MKKTFYILIFAFLGMNSTANAVTCTPTSEMEFSVGGVMSDDTLNVRAGPTTKYPVVTELRHNEVGIRYGGDRYFLDWECQSMCRKLVSGSTVISDEISSQCFQRNQVWFEIITPNGMTGWVSAKYLRVTKETVTQDESTNQPAVLDSVATQSNSSSTISKEFENSMLDRLFLELCYEGRYIPPSMWARIEAKYKERLSDSGLTTKQIQNVRERLKNGELYQFFLLGLITQAGGYDSHWQEECNLNTSAYLFK
ncbi:SH3 domain-containing protein [Aliiroseovarius sp. PrR006]|uniref:SH3 domain-containing protein n=1 Tax=Aliiroseovarius sp. PrR006 TaxID=2706883 RepID=UPI0013D1A221|nr:SH3 domain-containing protein [Aliiroseovarius sp. PrR006]NDW52128.1 hypothetical protein [Aliiroseovarius sp. PrR006]